MSVIVELVHRYTEWHVARAPEEPLFNTASAGEDIVLDKFFMMPLIYLVPLTFLLIGMWVIVQSAGVLSARCHRPLEMWVKSVGASLGANVELRVRSMHAKNISRIKSDGRWRNGESARLIGATASIYFLLWSMRSSISLSMIAICLSEMATKRFSVDHSSPV